MLSKLVQQAKRRLAAVSPGARKAARGRRARFETLELRALLSASHGRMHHWSGGTMDAPHRADQQRFGDAGMFAPVHYHRAFDGGGAYDGYRNEFGYYRPEMRREPHFGSYRRTPMTWYSYSPPAPARVQPPIIPQPVAASPLPPVSPPASPPVFAEDRRPSSGGRSTEPAKGTAPPDTGIIGLPPLPGAFPLPSSVTGAGKTVAEVIANRATTIGNTLGRISTIDGVSLASSILATRTDSSINISALPIEIRDTVFDRLLLVATDWSGLDIANSATAADAALPGEASVDDFLAADETTTAANALTPDQTLQQERDAVDEVLRGLHDLTDAAEINIPADSTSDGPGTDLYDPIENAKEIALDEVIDAGMVLLQATGDANESTYDLLAASSADAEFIGSHIRMMPSVGLHQALDVTADVSLPANRDELPAAEEATPAAEPQADTLKETTRPMVRSAAATIGFTTLFGVVAGKRESERRRRSAEAYQARIRPIRRVWRPDA
jgi:hypothetical protein